MAKRGADFQITKDNGPMPDFSFGGNASDPGGIQPQRATAQQMAKRKIATGKRSRVGSTGGGGGGVGGPTVPPPSFNFGAAPETNGFAFGATSTTFNSGGMSQPASSGGLGGSIFASAGGGGGGGGGGFGASSNSQTSSAPSANFNFASSSFNSNPFQSFGDKKPEASSTLTNGPSSLFASSHAPSAPSNPFFTNSKPPSSSAEAPKFSFGTTSTSSATPSFTAGAPASSAPERATSPFAAPTNSATPSFSFSQAKPPAQGGASPTFAANRSFTSEEITRVKGFIKEIEPKYQSLNAFKSAVKSQLEQLQRDGKATEILKSSTVDQQVEKFATELQSLQKTLANNPAATIVTFPQGLDQLLLSLVDNELGPSPTQPPKNPFQFQSASQPATTTSTSPSPFQTSASESSTSFSAASSPFKFPSAAPAQSSSSPFTQSSTPTPAAAPSQPTQPAQPAIDPAEFRSTIVKRATDKLAAMQPLKSSSDVDGLIRNTLNEVLTEKLPTMKPNSMPAGLTADQLHTVISKAVEEALAAIDKANAQNIQATIRQAIDAALPKIRSSITEAITAAQKSEPSSGAPSAVDPLFELERLKKECEQAYPPMRLPEDIAPARKQQLIAGYRIKLFSRAADQLQQSMWLQPLSEARFHQEYDRILTGWEREAGLKRKLTTPDATEPTAKRQNVNGFSAPTPAQGSLFGTPATNKRPAESDATEASAKRPREENSSPLPPAGSSQTSQLFASIAGAPEKASLFSSQPESQTKPANNASSLFAPAASTPGSASNIFGAAPKGDTSASNVFAPKASNASSIFSTTGFQNQSSEKPAASSAPSFGFKPTGGAPVGTNFFAQFTKQASDTEAKEKEKRKLEDYDSEEETEEEWEKRDAAEQAAKRQKFREAAQTSGGFVPKFGVTDNASEAGNVSETGKGNEADNEESDEHTGEEDFVGGEDGEEEDDDEDADGNDDDEDEQDAGEANSTAPATTTPGRSIFDRIQKPDISPEADHTWKPDTPIKFGNATTQLGGKSASEPESTNKNPFFSSASNSSASNPFASNTFGANPFAKPSQTNSTAAKDTGSNGTAAAPPTFSFTSASPQKSGTAAPSSNLFSNAAATSGEKPKSLFGFPSSGDTASGSSTFVNPFASLAKPGSLPSFNAQPSSNSLAPTSIFATASSSRATSPGMTTGDESTGSGADEAASNDPQLDLTSTRAGEENEDSLFEVRAKALELVKGGENGDAKGAEWVVRGVGQLRVLKNKETGKCRIILRAGPSARVVLNAGLIPTTTYTHPTPKSVSFLASNGGVLSKWTMQVGKPEDAKEMYELLEKHKAD